MADLHELVSKLKELAMELGRTPSSREFQVALRGGTYSINKVGGFSVIVQAAGLEPNRPGKIDNRIFNRDLEDHLDAYEPKAPIIRGPYPTIASISDIHWPFHNQRVVSRFIEFVGDTKPEHVVLNGDARDMYSFSRFPRSHNVFTPKDECEMGRKLNVEFWEQIKRASPKSACTQMLGNHCVRPLKQVLESYPSAEDWIQQAMAKEFSFPGVKTIMDPREEFMLGDIMIHHGYRSKLGEHRDFALYNAIVGHTHVGGVTFRQIRGQTLWELNSGLAGDPESKGLTYTKQRISNWTPGFGNVDKLGPRFIPV